MGFDLMCVKIQSSNLQDPDIAPSDRLVPKRLVLVFNNERSITLRISCFVTFLLDPICEATVQLIGWLLRVTWMRENYRRWICPTQFPRTSVKCFATALKPKKHLKTRKCCTPVAMVMPYNFLMGDLSIAINKNRVIWFPLKLILWKNCKPMSAQFLNQSILLAFDTVHAARLVFFSAVRFF